MLKYIFGFLFIALSWAAVFVFEELPAWPAIAVTVTVTLALVLVVLVKALKARKSAGAIEAALADGADKHGSTMRPEMQAQIEAMKLEFDKALRTLKSSRSGKHGKNALGILPWYVIIGPPGSGKSTVLRNSGLRFPYLSAKKGAIRGVGGTRNCDWWLSNDAILLDTAGRWSTEDEDTDEWLAFLDMLKRTRKRRAINGLIVAVSAADLLTGDEDAVGDLASRLRERCDEVMGRLEVAVPVYLIVTKCDLVSGFAETFGNLGDKERGQIWGFTLPLEASAEERTDVFIDKLDELLDVLEWHTLQRLGQERRLETREQIHHFPFEFEELCPNLVGLVKELFAPNAYQETPLLRGLYFTSGTQEGRPVDRIMKRMAEAFGIAPRMTIDAPVKAKAYFLTDVFRRVMFPDQNMAGLSAKAVKRRRVVSTAIAGTCLLAALGLAMTPISAYSRNLGLANDVKRFTAGLAEARDANGNIDPRKLEPLAETAEELWKLETEGPAASMTFGFYSGDDLREPLARALRDLTVAPLLAADAAALKTFATTRKGGVDDSRERLTRYLISTAPRAPEEPAVDDDGWAEAQLARARKSLVEDWKQRWATAGIAVSEKAEATLSHAIDLYALPARDNAALWVERDAETVERARATLRSLAEQDPLALVLSDPNLDASDLSLGRILGGAIVLFREDAKQPGAFTKGGYDLVRARISSLEKGEPTVGGAEDIWVMGPRKTLTPEEVDNLRTRYFAEYEKAWRGLLAQVYPRGPTDLSDAESLLRRHQDERPLDVIWKSLAANLELKSKADALVEQAAAGTMDKLLNKLGSRKEAAAAAAQREKKITGPDALKARFDSILAFGIPRTEGAEPALAAYYKQLGVLSQALTAYEETQDTNAIRKQVAQAKKDASELVMTFGRGGWEPVLNKMLMPLIVGVEELVIGAGAEAANRSWCDAVVTPYRELLADRYPFRLEGMDAALSEVENFFAPKTGTLWVYYDEKLQNDVETVGKRYRLKSKPTVQYRNELLGFLTKAAHLSELLFPNGADKLAPALQVRLKSAAGEAGTSARVTFKVGTGRPLEYGNWQERWEPLVWPGADAKIGIFGEVKGLPKELKENGDWALFRLFDKALRSLGRDSDEYMRAQWALGNPQMTVRMDVKPSDLLDALHGFEIPRTIAPGGSPCAQ
ncbi:MAG: type VI secretion system membrane subunit TssM [Myxococcales bacterium]|nr:type VI secretion system membrane subunit TssM [Myxococcales bacterium]